MEQSVLMSAYFAGLVSFLAPCLIPLLPSYFSVITGFTFQELYGLEHSQIRKRVIGSSMLFVLGFSLIYSLLGATGSLLGIFLRDQLNVLLRLSGFLMIFLGLTQLGIVNFEYFKFDYAWNIQRKLTKLGFLTAFITGMVAALSWIPCISPTLTPILILASSQSTVFEGSFLLFIFSLGLGTPFILSGLFFPTMVKSFKEHRRILHTLSILAGAVLIAFGLLLIFDYYRVFVAFIRLVVSKISF